jgi:hypothetical protein
MSTTINKGYATPTTGSEVGTWGSTLNDDVFAIIDRNLGGITTKNLSSSNVTLTAQESQSGILRLTGTLTANIQITTECIGFFLVENAASEAFAVTIKNNQVATAVTVAQGARTLVTSDATNGCRIGTKPFETGTKMAFYMAAAPVGWTKDTTAALDNAAIRIVTSSGGATGGTANFTDTFAARTIVRANLPNVTINPTVSITDPGHTHNLSFSGPVSGAGPGSFGGSLTRYASGSATSNGALLNTTGITATSSFNLNDNVSQTALNFAVKYANFIICTAD